MNQRIKICFYFVLALILILSLRLIYIQILQGVYYSEIAEKQYRQKVKTEGLRGEILDRNGNILAKSIESFSIYFRPKEFKNSKASVQKLENLLNFKVSQNVLKKDFLWIERKLLPQEVEKLSQSKIKGIGLVSEQKRYYPNGVLACYLLGSVGMDHHGLSGIEQTFDTFLSGKSQTLDQWKDGKGRKFLDYTTEDASQISQKNLSNTVILSVDRSLQYIAEKEIEKGVEENDAVSGIILIQNPHTGEILAMASHPGFDPNSMERTKYLEETYLQNGMVNHIYEPGSTFKVVAFAAALEEKKFALEELINCENGNWKIGSLNIHDHEPSGVISFQEVLEKSSNIGTAKIGLRLGKDLFFKYALAFGFGAKTGILLPGESQGLLRHPQTWSQNSLPTLSFGQEIGVTPLQLVNAFSSIANGGFLMEPHIVKELRRTEFGKTTKTLFSPQIIRRVVSEKTANLLKNMLVQVIKSGTGTQAQMEHYSAAGKTGTAQKIDPSTKQYSKSKYIASFCGFAPAQKPELVCLVILDEPKKTYWGGTTAAPIFSRVMSRSLALLEIPKEKKQPLALALKK
ncbi:MAG: penicillin-binding protein 2 [Elusimicrobia bacterium]|nr:penicillin-binding protein 2 [Elusimicrobiota bacterium]